MKTCVSYKDARLIVVCYMSFDAQSILLQIRSINLACLNGGTGRIKDIYKL